MQETNKGNRKHLLSTNIDVSCQTKQKKKNKNAMMMTLKV